SCISLFIFFNYTSTSGIYTLSLHDALPICLESMGSAGVGMRFIASTRSIESVGDVGEAMVEHPHAGGESNSATNQCSQSIQPVRSEEHTSELQSLRHLVCRLLLEKKKKKKI